MDYTNISFMSTLRHNMNIDLELIKFYLSQNMKDVSFRYFISDGTKGNYMVKRGLREREINFSNKMSHAICIDPSLPLEVDFEGKDFKRIMISLPFGTQFKDLYVQAEKGIRGKRWICPNLHIL